MDTWKGDIHMFQEVDILEDLRAYHDPHFATFSTLLQMTFDEARETIENRSIDLLHIDGTHTYAAVKHDFENWKSALSSRSIVLFHDTCVRRDNYEVWRLWDELSGKYPSFEFRHSFGLGVLAVGEDLPPTLRNLFAMSEDDRMASTVRALFASCGDAHVRNVTVSRLEQDLKAEREDATRREGELQYWKGWVKAEHDKLEQDLKAERDGAARREAALQALVEAASDTAHRSAQVVQESTAQNRRLSEEVANLQTQLHSIRTSKAWRATWPIRRVVFAIQAPIRWFRRRGRRERMLASAEPLPVEGRSVQSRPHDYSHLQLMFDEDWYDRTYELKDEELHGFAHYLAKGAQRGFSPSADFDEEFYSAFYGDVRMAISSRGYLCGYEHYVLLGQAENRLTKPILTKMLDVRYPGITDPIGVAQKREIARKLTPISACSGADEQSYWILVPMLDPNIFFGGYKGLIEFIVGLAALKRPITIVICQADDDGSYFRWWIRRHAQIAPTFKAIRIVNGRRVTAPLRLSPTDKIFAYSAWEAHLAHQMAAYVESGMFAWLVQEYEAIFHDYSAEHVITAGAYQLPHYPIFNSTELKDYFQHHRLGIFSGDRQPSARRDFAVFDHVLTKLSAPSLADLKSRPSRTLIFYARPESHAKRNLFPLALIALEEMAQQGSFIGSWEFHGVGALTEMTMPLGCGHQLNVHAKMTEAEYIAFMHKVDIGLSLMYAPHPGLIAFEMASVGARVVTNTFDSRSEIYLRGLSENIVPCEPTISGIKKGLTEAIERLEDFSGRVSGMRINRPQGKNSWSEVFNDDFFRCEMGGFLGTDQQIPSG